MAVNYTATQVERILNAVRANIIATKFSAETNRWSDVTYDMDDCVKVDDLNRVLDCEIARLK